MAHTINTGFPTIWNVHLDWGALPSDPLSHFGLHIFRGSFRRHGLRKGSDSLPYVGLLSLLGSLPPLGVFGVFGSLVLCGLLLHLGPLLGYGFLT